MAAVFDFLCNSNKRYAYSRGFLRKTPVSLETLFADLLPALHNCLATAKRILLRHWRENVAFAGKIVNLTFNCTPEFGQIRLE